MKIEIKVYYSHTEDTYKIREYINNIFQKLGMDWWASGSDGVTYDMAFDWPLEKLIEQVTEKEK